MDDKVVIGRNIKSYRTALGLNQQQLGKLVGVSRGTINYYESGSRMPSVFALQKLSDLFGIDAIELTRENSEELAFNSVIAFKKKNLLDSDLKSIARFRRIVKNYIKLKENY